MSPAGVRNIKIVVVIMSALLLLGMALVIYRMLELSVMDRSPQPYHTEIGAEDSITDILVSDGHLILRLARNGRERIVILNPDTGQKLGEITHAPQ